MSKRPELTAAERALPYAKFYDLPITPIPEEKLAVLAAGPIDPSLALKIEDRNDLFKPGYLPCEIGYCVMPNGTGFLANRTEMPGVTPEMFEWWFAWHSLEDLRYRIWDPEDHYYARQQMREKTLDQSLPMRERTWGTVHHVLEDIGPGPDELVLEFRYPHELGYEEEKVGTDACAALICANGHGPADVPDRYSLTDVAAFTRWYLSDYPVQVRVREDGLLVAGGPKGSTWKHPFVLDMDVLKTIPFWFAGLFLLALLGVLGLTALVLGRQFRREQQERDFARSDWINGISLFVVVFVIYPMGYSIYRAADLPRTLLPGAIATGAFGITMTAVPGTPQIQNLIPTDYYGTTTAQTGATQMME